MSVDVYLHLVDSEAIHRVALAVYSFLRHNNAGPLEPLLQDATTRTGVPESLRDYYRSECDKLLRGNLPDEVLDDSTGDVLRDQHQIREYQAERTLNRFLILQLCIRSEGRRQTTFQLNRFAFANYLRQRSHWLDETFSLSNDVLWTANRICPSMGGDAWILIPSQSARILDATKKVPLSRDRGLRKEQQDFLWALQRAASDDSSYRILVRMF